ncbi:hypothetical protein GR925_01660 [Streptomyces sp. HUCO-GS316]|uniref:hypothetical protein n=1 Tax=Streptomyces sp. HUCO-GS316 TaxID=2692198 RepID=UPI00136F44F9|nr:hypothetical protein [Streptomyces sp. HUCO-GS316]MXM62189.1 hypothetical protein [Streptomyces sp. HUCO-GS316]
MFLVLLTRAPDEATLRAAVHLAENAAVAAWALRPDGLAPLTVEQYRQLLDYAAAPQILDMALYIGGDRKQIRTLMDFITGVMADIQARYPTPRPRADQS